MWLLNRNGKIWLMKSDTDKYIDSISMTDVKDYKQLNEFIDKLSNFKKQASTIVTSAGDDPEKYVAEFDPVQEPGKSAKYNKPPVIPKPTPNKSSRNGQGIRSIIMHCTTTRNDQSTINWFANPASQVSAHYLISRSGTIYQFVSDADKAWHATSANGYSIGIEHAADPSDTLTYAQERASIDLLKYLVSEYDISLDNIIGHKHATGGTTCPNNLWPTQQDLSAWVRQKLGGIEAGAVTAECYHTGQKYASGPWAGLLQIKLKIGDIVFDCASGAPGRQVLRKPQDPRSTAGNMEPIPQGLYSISDIQWADGKDNYNASWGSGLGPVWVGLSAKFSDDRGAFGIHLDENINWAAGSAGCLVVKDIQDLTKLVDSLRKYDPKTLNVNWGL